jgi:hypothetical protein
MFLPNFIRYRSVKNSPLKARLLLVSNIPCMVLVNLLLLIPGGILVYIHFHGCNPMYTRKVVNKNQIGAYWLYLVLNDSAPALCGILFASIVFAAVVQHSQGMSLLTKSIMSEIVAPFAPSIVQKKFIRSCTLAFLGMISILIAISLDFVKNTMIAVFFLINNSINSPILGLFLLAAFNPYSNGVGAMLGFASNLAINFFVGFGSLLVATTRSQEFTPETHKCEHDFHRNLTSLNVYDINQDLHHDVNTTHPHEDDFFPKDPTLYFIFTIAPIWYCLFSVLYTFITGSLFSFLYSLIKTRSLDADRDFAEERKQYLYIYRMFPRTRILPQSIQLNSF